MKLNNIEFIKLLPQWMRDDAAVKCLADSVDKFIPAITNSIKSLSTWDSIDDLTEEELDELAWELNISWYDKNAGLDAKRDIIKNSDQVYKRMGTKWAVENVIKSYFGDGYILEWFEYDGIPGHFQVHSSNPSLSEEKFSDFVSLIEKIKRATARLDSIVLSMTGDVPLYAGFALHEVGTDTYDFGT